MKGRSVMKPTRVFSKRQKSRSVWGVYARDKKIPFLIRQIKTGYPIATFEHLKDDLGVNLQKLAAITNISLATLHRRKVQSQRLTSTESERIFRLLRLYGTALEVLEDRNFVKTWLNTPQKVFENKTAIEYADTQPGAEEVERVLKRMEHGVAL
jgi:putative toxin-antitoxin system antitoxin component (TIGR02293 family)